MLKKTLFFMTMLCATFLLTSCFDVVEEIDLNTNGSGRIKATVNLSKSKTKVASLMKLDKIDGIKVPTQQEIHNEVNKVSAILKATKGISNVTTALDFTNFIGTISCDFTDINALNNFSNTLSKQFKTKISDYSSYSFNTKTKVFNRSYKYANEGKKELSKLKPENQKSLHDAYFTYIYRFQGTVAKQQNGHAKVAANKKAVMLKANVLDIVNGKVDLANTINLN